METDDGSTTNEDTDEPTVDVVSDATDNESQISGKVLIYTGCVICIWTTLGGCLEVSG
jgi:hypothetical protein